MLLNTIPLAPVIYEYFSNKEAIISRTNPSGISAFCAAAKDRYSLPAEQLEAMGLAWNFAFKEKRVVPRQMHLRRTSRRETVHKIMPESESQWT